MCVIAVVSKISVLKERQAASTAIAVNTVCYFSLLLGESADCGRFGPVMFSEKLSL